MEAQFREIGNIKQTIETLKKYADVISFIKGSKTPHQKNWEEFSLKFYAKGLTTTPIPYDSEGSIEALDININFNEQKLKIFAGKNRDEITLAGQSQFEFTEELKNKLKKYGVNIDFPEDKFVETKSLFYSPEEALLFWDVLRQIYFVFLEFKGEITEETSGINFWAHHFDVGMLWFSGRLIEGQDPENWVYSREQMNFGFSPGDDGINEPYFYVTAYPFPKKITETELPGGAYWHTEGWNGAVLMYSDLLKFNDSRQALLNFFQIVFKLASDKMKR